VERVNTALAAVLGRPAAECRGRSVAELIPGLAGVLLPVLGQIVTRGEAVPEFEFSSEAPGSGAQTRHWLSAFFPVRTDGDALAGVGIILRDITARHDASARERRRSHHRMALHSITAALAEAITPREVVAVVVAHAASAFGAVGSVIARRTPDGREVEVPGADGLPSDIAGEWARFPISAPAPLAYVAHGRVALPRVGRRLEATLPELHALAAEVGQHVNMVVPLMVERIPSARSASRSLLHAPSTTRSAHSP
jgi:hypothetical protein